eukprot:8303230-Pyramimonas_sp.AAC.1
MRQRDGDEGDGGDNEEEPSLGWCGPWRAFVAESDVGMFRDFHELGARYREIKANDPVAFAALQASGEQAAARRRAGDQRPFGPTKRDLDREALVNRQEARRKQMEDRLSGRLDDDDGDFRVDMAEAIAQGGGSFEASLQAAREDARWFGRLKAEDERQMKTDLLNYSVQQSGELGRAMFGAARETAPLIGQLGTAPSAMEGLSHMCYQSQAAARATCVAALVASARTADGKTAMPLLGADWGRKHCMQMHATAEPIKKETAAEKRQWRCARAGVHLCGVGGGRTWAFRNSILRFLKVRCPKESTMRKMLVDGGLIMCVLRVPAEPADHGAPLNFEADGVVCSYFHLAVHYLNPYRPTLQTMVRLRWDGED